MAELLKGNGIRTDAFPALFTLIVGAIFGGSMVFVTPPFDVPEEGQHFFRCYQCSQGKVYAILNDVGVPGGDLPESLSDVSLAIHNKAKNEYDLRMSAEKIKRVLTFPIDRGRKHFAGFPSTGRFSPMPYLPAAVAMWVGRKAKCTALEELYFGRVGTLAGYLLLVAAAVWLMPIHKWTMSLVALMPMSIFLAASLSADALTIAFSLLSIAMILRLGLRSENADRRSLLWLGTVLVCLALVKQAYVLVALLFLMVPQAKFADRGQCWRIRTLMIALPIAVCVAWTYSARELCVPYRTCVDTHAQALWILANPWPFAQRVITRLTDGDVYAGIIATLGWGTIWVAKGVYPIYWTALLATAVLDGGQEEVQLSKTARAICAAVYAIVLTAIATLTFLCWQSVGEDVIHGVQSRYFPPLLPLLLVPLRGSAKLASSRFSRWLVPVAAIVTVLIGMGATWQAVIARFYWN
jgi:uncharacterized membrane protein